MLNAEKVSLKPFFVALFLGLALVTGWFLLRDNFGGGRIKTFEDCKNAGNPVMLSYPEQCTANGQTFINTTQLSTQ